MESPAGTPSRLADQAEAAESLGFHSLWLPESHFTGRSACPAPLLLLAAAAARTRSLRVGTTSFLLPVRHPLHVAEEVAVLDGLSGGRVILGVGRGFRRSLFAAFGVPPEEKRDRFEESLRVMQAAWRGEPLEPDSAHDPPLRLAPLPVQRPHPPLWVAAFGPKAVAQAGRLGLPYLASPIETLDTLVENTARHHEALEAAGSPGPTAVPVMRSVFLSRAPDRIRQVREALAGQASALARAPVATLRRAAVAEVDDWALVGEPAQVATRLGVYRERMGVTHLIARTHVPGASAEDLTESLHLLAGIEC